VSRSPAASLPDFPWDRLVPAVEQARAHPGGIVDLSVGTPVDPTPDIVQRALHEASNSPGYPFTAGTAALRESICRALSRRCGADLTPDSVLPSIGTKEIVALLPTLLGLGVSDAVAVPRVAYPTYAVGALLAGCAVVEADSVDELEAARPALVWLNSPSNPTGRVAPAAEMAAIVAWARSRGALVVSDECYFDLGWTSEPVSVLHPSVCGTSHNSVVALQSLSKRSNLAGYRFGFAAGDSTVLARVLEVRKHAGLIVPGPVQQAAIAALDDDLHVAAQRLVYGARRDQLLPALRSAGFRVDHSEAGLYLWCTRDEPCWITVDWLAQRGILVAPGDFYGSAGNHHVRVALTATDERISAAVTRLTP